MLELWTVLTSLEWFVLITIWNVRTSLEWCVLNTIWAQMGNKQLNIYKKIQCFILTYSIWGYEVNDLSKTKHNIAMKVLWLFKNNLMRYMEY